MNNWKSVLKILSLIVAVAAIAGLIYANFYAPQYSEELFIAASIAVLLWWLVTFQFFTGSTPGLLTSKVDKALLTAHAGKLQAEANVHLGRTAIAEAKTSQLKAEFELHEAPGNLTRAQLLSEALHDNQLLVTRRATQMGIPVQDYTGYLLKTLEEKVKYETSTLIANTELTKERMSIEQTLRLALTESTMKFEERMRLIDQMSQVKNRIKNANDRTTKRLLQEELATLQAKLDALK